MATKKREGSLTLKKRKNTSVSLGQESWKENGTQREDGKLTMSSARRSKLKKLKRGEGGTGKKQGKIALWESGAEPGRCRSRNPKAGRPWGKRK